MTDRITGRSTDRSTRDREALASFFRRALAPHAYAIADLDDFFWPTTTVWALPGSDKHPPRKPGQANTSCEIAAAVLMVEKLSPPIIYALCPGTRDATSVLLGELLPNLPKRFFFNLDLAHLELLRTAYRIRPHMGGKFQKMVLDPVLPLADAQQEPRCEVLRDPDELRDFYENDAYAPDEKDERFLEPYMFEMEPYVGIRDEAGGRLLAVGGVHLVSETYGVAALGNIATRPDARSHGHSRAIVTRLCRSLRRRGVSCITLNVAVDNTPAIRSYRAVGFSAVYRYAEGLAEAKKRA